MREQSGLAGFLVSAASLLGLSVASAQVPPPEASPAPPPAAPPAAAPPHPPAQPGAAYPPPGYAPYPQPYPYPPPPYGYPVPYPVPTPMATEPPRPAEPLVIQDWDPATPPPKGYRLETSVNGRIIRTGVILLGTAWLGTLLVASVGAAAEEDEVNDEADGVTAGDWSALYVPVFGPFIAIHTLDAKPSGMGLLLADGVMQLGGAAGIVWGIVDKEYRAVRLDTADLEVRPAVTPQFAGVTARGRF